MKLKPSKLMILALTAAMGLTGCGKTPTGPDDPGEEIPDVARLLSISFEHNAETIEEEGSIDLRILYNPSNISSSQKPLRYSSNNPSVAVVDENFGTVTGVSAGQAVITATSRIDPSITATCTITVTAKDRSIPVERVALDRKEATISAGGYTFVNATVYGANNKLATDRRLTWSTNNPTVATIDGTDRKITGVSAGTAIITATSVADPTKSDSITVEVTDSYIRVASVTLDKQTLALQDEDNPIGQLTVTVSSGTEAKPTDQSVTWEALDSEGHTSDVIALYVSGEASVSIRALKAGSAIVKVISNADSTKYATCEVTVAEKGERDVNVHVTGIAFVSSQQDKVEFGGTLPVQAVVTPNNAGNKNITYALKSGSTLPEGTTFDTTTLIITAGNVEGDFVIVATAEDTVNGTYSVEKTFHVVDPVTHVSELVCSMTGTNTIYIGDEINLADGAGVVSVLPADATNKELDYSKGDSNAVSIDSSGLLRAIAEGQATITISTREKGSNNQPLFTKSFTVDVKKIPVSRVVLNSNELTLGITESFDLNATVYYRHPNKTADEQTVGDDDDVTFAIDNTGISSPGTISLSATGGIIASAIGDVRVKAVSKQDSSIMSTCLIHVVNKKPLVMSFSLPETINAYNRSVREENLTSTENLYKNSNISKGQFFEGNKDELIYKVGNQGKFKFEPIARARYYNAAGEETGTKNIDAVIVPTWEIASFDTQWSNYVELPSADLGTYIQSYENGKIEFKSAAVGHRFKVTLTVAESPNYILNEPFAQEFEFEVKNGYNAYTVEELSFFNNFTGSVSAYAYINWAPVRSAANLPASIEGDIILHNDITIDSSVFPEEVLWTEDEVNLYLATSAGRSDFTTWMNLMGIEDEEEAKELLYDTPNDYLNIFARNTQVGEDFAVEGNFFKIDASKLKQIRLGHENNPEDTLISFQNGDGSHGQIFGINSLAEERTPGQTKGSVSFNNLKFVGNGGIEASAAKAASVKETNVKLYNRYMGDVRMAKGGFIGIKTGYTNVYLNNNIHQGHFIGLMTELHDGAGLTAEQTETTLDADRLLAYDSYNSMFYFWGTAHNNIKNSWLTGAGGPLILMDEPNFGDESNPNMRHVEALAENSYLYNPVTGTEPWFEQNHAASMVQSYLVNPGDPNNDLGWIGKIAQGTFAAATTGTALEGLSKAQIDAAHEAGMVDDTTYAQLRGINTITNNSKKINFIAIDVHAHNFAGNTFGQLTGKIEVRNVVDGSGNAVAGHPDNITMDLSLTEKTSYEYETGKYKVVVDKLVGKNSAKIVAVSSTLGTAYIDGSDNMTVIGDNYAGFVAGNYMSYYLDPVLAAGNTTATKGFVGALLGTCSYYDNWVA